MRKNLVVIFLGLFFCIDAINAASVRTQNAITRPETINSSNRQSANSKTINASRAIMSRTATPTKTTDTKKTASRQSKNVLSRTATKTITLRTRTQVFVHIVVLRQTDMQLRTGVEEQVQLFP